MRPPWEDLPNGRRKLPSARAVGPLARRVGFAVPMAAGTSRLYSWGQHVKLHETCGKGRRCSWGSIIYLQENATVVGRAWTASNEKEVEEGSVQPTNIARLAKQPMYISQDKVNIPLQPRQGVRRIRSAQPDSPNFCKSFAPCLLSSARNASFLPYSTNSLPCLQHDRDRSSSSPSRYHPESWPSL